MYVILDTNALHGQVYADGSWTNTLFKAAELRDDIEVRVPSVVIEELVRQFPERLQKIESVFSNLRHDASAFGLSLPPIPDLDEAVAGYRGRLEGNLDRPNVEISPPPSDAGLIAEWVAQRREPFFEEKNVRNEDDQEAGSAGDGTGVVDAQIWLTAVELAESDEVVLITSNWRDFSTKSEKSQPHPTLEGDLEKVGAGGRIRIMDRILDFNREFVGPNPEAQVFVEGKLKDPQTLAELKDDVARSMTWLELPDDYDNQFFNVEIDGGTIQHFEIDSMELLIADRALDRTSGTVRAAGNALVQAFLFKGEAHSIGAASPYDVIEWDYNESMAVAEVEIPMLVTVGIVWSPSGFSLQIEDISPVSDTEVQDLMGGWRNQIPEALSELVSEEFSQFGEREAVSVRYNRPRNYFFARENLVLEATFSIDFRNQIDEHDTLLSAENVTDFDLDLIVPQDGLDDKRNAELVVMPPAFLVS